MESMLRLFLHKPENILFRGMLCAIHQPIQKDKDHPCSMCLKLFRQVNNQVLGYSLFLFASYTTLLGIECQSYSHDVRGRQVYELSALLPAGYAQTEMETSVDFTLLVLD